MSAIDRMGRPLRDGPFRGNVRVAATSPIELYGLQTIDGVALTQGDRVLVAAQGTLPEDNGIYIASSASWSRARDMCTSDDFLGPVIASVEEGDVYRNEIFWFKAAVDVVVGQTPIIWNQGLGGLANQRRGMWNPLIDYATGDLVTWQNIEYIALIGNVNSEPPNGAVWDVTHDPFDSKPIFGPSTDDQASLNLANGVTPDAPVEGDVWATGNGLHWFIGGFDIRILTNNDFTAFPLGSQIGFNSVTSFTSNTITGAGNVVTFDTDPFLVSEGTEIASLTYACKLASGSKLEIEAQIPFSATTSGYAIFGVFRGSTQVGIAYSDIANGKTTVFLFKGSVAAHPGDTSSATYSLRAAVGNSANSYIVNSASSTLFGGNKIGVVFTVREVRTP